MEKETLIAAGVDYAGGVHRFAGNEAMYLKFVGRFPADPSFGQIKAALDAGEVETAFRAAHTLKGTAGNLSFDALLEQVKPLVEALRGGDLALAKALYPATEAEYNRVVTAING